MKDHTLYTLFKAFVFEISPLIDPVLNDKWIKPKYDKYPTLKYKENGMPEISNYTSNPPPKINDLFVKWGGDADIKLENFDSYKNLKDYLFTHREYKSCIYPEHVDLEQAEDFYKTLGAAVIKDLLERYYLLNQKKEENELLFNKIYSEIENYIYADELYFDIAVPVLFLRFSENYVVNSNLMLRRISDDHQKARFNRRSYSPIADPLVSSATHELVFNNYYMKKGNKYFDNSLSNESAYPVWKFELFFNALKIVTNYNSGFAQILVYPHEWADHYDMDLPLVKGITVKKYPNYFEDFYWNAKEFPLVNHEEIKEVFAVYVNLLENENNKIQIANRRLRYSYLRDNEEDSILDIIIALETLLSDNEKGEITHKLALRIAKLISVFNDTYNPHEVFSAIKKIYAFRSAIVHGSSKIDSHKEIKLHPEAKPIKTIQLANDYLREVLRILIKEPSYLDSREIDKLLLA